MTEEIKVEEMGFEEAMTALEALVAQLEEGTLSLEESLGVYERAVALRERCRSILEDGERRVQKLIDGPDGPSLENFD